MSNARGVPLQQARLARALTMPSVAPSIVVFFGGLAPDPVGLYQVNVQVPDGAPTGDSVRVVLTMGDAGSNTVTIAVQ